jgi:hypothetical protein
MTTVTGRKVLLESKVFALLSLISMSIFKSEIITSTYDWTIDNVSYRFLKNGKELSSREFEITGHGQRASLSLCRNNDYIDFDLSWKSKAQVRIRLCAKWKVLVVDVDGKAKNGKKIHYLLIELKIKLKYLEFLSTVDFSGYSSSSSTIAKSQFLSTGFDRLENAGLLRNDVVSRDHTLHDCRDQGEVFFNHYFPSLT